ncbi:hypothetical protein BKA81DRAFT_125925 [Phyllosticta paracitricarpa]|uniref:Uncharacterized protein n=1 Tax=Phyllosticta paracitricarpa TaxID=2016321 RepID=A0ABR1N3I7_9PEZI
MRRHTTWQKATRSGVHLLVIPESLLEARQNLSRQPHHHHHTPSLRRTRLSPHALPIHPGPCCLGPPNTYIFEPLLFAWGSASQRGRRCCVTFLRHAHVFLGNSSTRRRANLSITPKKQSSVSSPRPCPRPSPPTLSQPVGPLEPSTNRDNPPSQRAISNTRPSHQTPIGERPAVPSACKSHALESHSNLLDATAEVSSVNLS